MSTNDESLLSNTERSYREPRDLVRDLAGEFLAERPLEALLEEVASNPAIDDGLFLAGLTARGIDYGEAYNLLNEVRRKRARNRA